MHVAGVFEVIEPPSRIVFSWNIEPPDEHAGLRSEVHVSIAPDDNGSVLAIRHLRLDGPNAPSRHREGWRGALEGLAAMLASGERASGRA